MKAWYFLILLLGCEPADTRHVSTHPSQRREPTALSDDAPTRDGSPLGPSASPPVRAPIPLRIADYPWHADPSIDALKPVEPLVQRFAPPRGYDRVAVRDESFGAWLRGLPLASPGTPVRSYAGGVHLPSDHRNIAAVTTLDVGSRDLQQCADAIMRLHGEWLWHRGRADEASYPSGGGPIPWKRYLAGGYPALQGNSFVWKSRSRRQEDHGTYRKYMDVVFSWANTVALAQKTEPVKREDLEAGDFFVLAGNPGHSVLVLDVAENDAGKRVALLGQSFMPAQSFQVLRPSRDGAWFSLDDEDGVQTPFWRRFPWSSLRRL